MAPYRLQSDARRAFRRSPAAPRVRRGPELETGPPAFRPGRGDGPEGSPRSPASGLPPGRYPLRRRRRARRREDIRPKPGAAATGKQPASRFVLVLSFIRRVQGSNLFRRAVLKPWTRTSEHALRMRRAPDGQRPEPLTRMAREEYCRKHSGWRAPCLRDRRYAGDLVKLGLSHSYINSSALIG